MCWIFAASHACAQQAPLSVELTVRAFRPAWVRVRVDGRPPFQKLMQPSDGPLTWRGRRVIFLQTGNAGGVRLTLNGNQLPTLGRSGQVVFRRFAARPMPIAVCPPVRATPPPIPKPAPKPLAPKASERPVQVRAHPAPPPSPAKREAFHLPLNGMLNESAADWASVAVLLILLTISVWMLIVIRHESGEVAALGTLVGGGTGIKIVTAQNLARGKTLYVVEAGGRFFVMATGDVSLIGEVVGKELGALGTRPHA
jgi:hypothetical protein